MKYKLPKFSARNVLLIGIFSFLLIQNFLKDKTYYELGVYEIVNKKEVKLICKKTSIKNAIRAVSYSDKLKPEIAELHKKIGVTEFIKMKSSIKFCVIATGEYDLYVAVPRANEWDIAAGHAILKNAGGVITDFNGNEIFYGKKNFKNTSLILKRNFNLK